MKEWHRIMQTEKHISIKGKGETVSLPYNICRSCCVEIFANSLYYFKSLE